MGVFLVLLMIAVFAVIIGAAGRRDRNGGTRRNPNDPWRSGAYREENRFRTRDEIEAKRAGDQGEEAFARLLGKVLWVDDMRFRNVEVEYDGRRAELDEVVVNRYGVTIIEVKNYSGQLYGSEEDYEWRRIKVSGGGKEYIDTLDNPFGQLRREIDILARHLRSYGCDVWVEGYLYFMNDNCPVESERVLRDEADINRAIHTLGRRVLTREEQNRIAGSISSRGT